MAWTEERVEELKQLWSEGLSASQIANRMGGVTRNAVIGKVHRLGLSGRATPTAPKPKAVVAPPADVKPLRATEGLEHLFPGLDKPTVSSIGGSQCKWPIGDPAAEDFHFCGQPTSQQKPYCAYHSQVAFQPNSTSRREPRRATQTALPKMKAVN